MHIGEKIRKISRAHNELAAELGREPTHEEVAEGLRWSVEEVELAREAMPDATSLERPVDPVEGASELGSFVEDQQASAATDAVARRLEAAQLREAIDELPERLRYVLVRRYGLGGVELATLTELSHELNISRERVRQIQRKAEQALKSGEHARLLCGVAANDPVGVLRDR